MIREMGYLHHALGVAVKGWICIMVFSAVVIYFCSIVLAHGAHPLCESEADQRALCEHFSSIGTTFFSLYKAIFGG
eukprot:5748830-Amphidinium_carterae.1